jgi:hypothetical protein
MKYKLNTLPNFKKYEAIAKRKTIVKSIEEQNG